MIEVSCIAFVWRLKGKVAERSKRCSIQTILLWLGRYGEARNASPLPMGGTSDWSVGFIPGCAVGEILLPHLIPRMIFEALKDFHDAQTITDEMLANELSRVDRTYGSTTWLCNKITDPVKLNEAFECLVYDVVNSTDDIWGVTLEAIRDALLPSWISWTRLLKSSTNKP